MIYIPYIIKIKYITGCIILNKKLILSIDLILNLKNG